MVARVAVNGFGRIGRLVLRAALEGKRKDLEYVAINDLGSSDANAHLLNYDSVHGPYPGRIRASKNSISIDGKKIRVFSERNPENLPWDALGIDLVLECTGLFTSKEKATGHLDAGAKRVLISAPCSDADLTVVYGVNHNKLRKKHRIVSNASCTTNCLVPIVYVLDRSIGIRHGFMTTIHSFTGDQRTVDTLHPDLSRSRTASMSMIPTSTGAARAVGLVLPELKGRLDGTSIRVPTPNVSLIDLTFTAKQNTSVERVNEIITKAASGKLRGILATNNKPLVSIDFNHNSASSIFDLAETQVVDQKFVRILSWYDNEWGFSNRMNDTAAIMGGMA